jgi:hypothetical protein
MRGKVDGAGFLSRPAVSSQTRVNKLDRGCHHGCLGVGNQLPVDGVGDSTVVGLSSGHRWDRGMSGPHAAVSARSRSRERPPRWQPACR